MKKQMRLAMIMVVAATSALMAFAADEKPAAAPAETKQEKKYASLAEARAKIEKCISDPAQMTEVMKTLSPEDQKTFVADVNAAIAKLPGSVEDKTAKYLNANRAAIKGAAQGNMANVLAVTFASVPPESLTVISERYANDLFNRDADPSHKFTDAAYEKTATEVLGKVSQATTGSDDAGVRNTLAVLMFVRADNGKSEDIVDKLVAAIPDAATRELAKKDWIPAAMASGDKKSYDAMLAYADAGRAPDLNIVLSLAGPQILDAALVDITSGIDNSAGIQTTPALDQAFGGFDETRIVVHNIDTKSATTAANGGSEVPRTTDPNAPWNPEYKRGDLNTPHTPPEPQPYPFGVN